MVVGPLYDPFSVEARYDSTILFLYHLTCCIHVFSDNYVHFVNVIVSLLSPAK